MKFGKCNGFPASLYELVQQLGRVDRSGTAEPGSNTYEIHVDLYSYVSLFIRIMQVDNPEERKVQLKQLHEVMLFLVVTTACYHKVIEEYFEWERANDKRDCMHYFSKCLKEVGGFTKRVNMEGLQSMLEDKVPGSSKTIR